MTVEEAKEIVLSEHPDAQIESNDYNAHWVVPGPPISEVFVEDRVGWDEVHAIHLGPDYSSEKINEMGLKMKKLEQDAQDKAWINAAEKLRGITR